MLNQVGWSRTAKRTYGSLVALPDGERDLVIEEVLRNYGSTLQHQEVAI